MVVIHLQIVRIYQEIIFAGLAHLATMALEILRASVCSNMMSPHMSSINYAADFNECEHEACDPLTLCTNLNGSYLCSPCPVGYDGTGYTHCSGRRIMLCRFCYYTHSNITTDIDECLGVNNCSLYATCNNTVGSYGCNCGPGFYGNGFICKTSSGGEVGRNLFE